MARWVVSAQGRWGWAGQKQTTISLTARGHTFCVPTVEVDRLKLTLEDTTDFFGRVVIYHLRVLGEKAV